MVKRVGEEIQRNSKILTFLMAAPSVLLAAAIVAILAAVMESGGLLLGLLAGGVVAGIGIWTARVFTAMMEGFGIIVEYVEGREYKADEREKTDIANEETSYDEEMIYNAGSATAQRRWVGWRCVFCDIENNINDRYCRKCGCSKADMDAPVDHYENSRGWICPSCQMGQGAAVNFCPRCGTPKP